MRLFNAYSISYYTDVLNTNMVTSILKWAGGKRRIVHFLSKFFPDTIDQYYEPFLGSGALFLYLAQTRTRFKAILSDSNSELINVYNCVRDNVNDLVDVLEMHQYNYYRNPKEYYYYIRDIYCPANNIENACRLLFLNKTCYNGLYRVNKSGSFNVPHGTYKHPVICNRKKLHDFSEILKRTDAEITCQYWQHVTERCERGDLVYFDPPYYPLSKTCYFKDYTKDEFGHIEQKMLAKEFKRLSRIGCTVLLSNSKSPFITDLYKGFNIMTLSTIRPINCNASNRQKHHELLITNKEIPTEKRSVSNYKQMCHQI